LTKGPSIFIGDKPILSSERKLHKEYDARVQLQKKTTLDVILKGLGDKTN
jgi:hypothetical protein